MKKTLSATEFKSWISGVTEMQEKTWAPNAQQWAKIKAKIDMLEEGSYTQEYETPFVSQVSNPIPQISQFSQPLPSSLAQQDIGYMSNTNGYVSEFM